MLQKPAPADVTDSDAELDFQAICLKRGVPVPEKAQHRVETTPGQFSVADWAYPSANVLIYIDGMSEGIHGKPGSESELPLSTKVLQQRGRRWTSSLRKNCETRRPSGYSTEAFSRICKRQANCCLSLRNRQGFALRRRGAVPGRSNKAEAICPKPDECSSPARSSDSPLGTHGPSI